MFPEERQVQLTGHRIAPGLLPRWRKGCMRTPRSPCGGCHTLGMGDKDTSTAVPPPGPRWLEQFTHRSSVPAPASLKVSTGERHGKPSLCPHPSVDSVDHLMGVPRGLWLMLCDPVVWTSESGGKTSMEYGLAPSLNVLATGPDGGHVAFLSPGLLTWTMKTGFFDGLV